MNDWLKVGEALAVGREWAMNQARTDKPEGKPIWRWMMQYKLYDMEKSDRSRLFEVMAALPMIEEWRRTLTLERLKLNHPARQRCAIILITVMIPTPLMMSVSASLGLTC